MYSFSFGLHARESYDDKTPIRQGYAYAQEIIGFIRRYLDSLKQHPDHNQDPISLWAQAIGYAIDYPLRAMQDAKLPAICSEEDFRNYAANIVLLVSTCPSLGWYQKGDKNAHPLAQFFSNVLCYEFLKYKPRVIEVLVTMMAKIPDHTNLADILVTTDDWGIVNKDYEADKTSDCPTQLWQLMVEVIAQHSQRGITLDHFRFAEHAASIGYPRTAHHITETCKFNQRQQLRIAKVIDGVHESEAQDAFVEQLLMSHEVLEAQVATLKRQLAAAEDRASKAANTSDEERRPARGPGHFGRTSSQV